MADNSQSRKWQLTINNYQDHNITDELLKETLLKFVPDYYCMCKEIGNETKTPHIHIFIYAKSPIRFTTLKNRFPTAHIEKAFGTIQDNIDYVRKTGKFENTDKAETSIEGSFVQYGTIPSELQEKHPVLGQLLENIKDGKSNVEIMEENPEMALKLRDIDLIRETYLADKYMKENRNIVCTYVWGNTGCGKTRDIYKRHGAKNVCRITNYIGTRGVNFDSYKSTMNTLVFEEFHSQIPIGDMLNYLDIYPLMLPARYNDKVACYTYVYITSNMPLEEQYFDLHYDSKYKEVWKALLRRIHNIIEYKNDGSIIEHKMTKKLEDKENEEKEETNI